MNWQVYSLAFRKLGAAANRYLFEFPNALIVFFVALAAAAGSFVMHKAGFHAAPSFVNTTLVFVSTAVLVAVLVPGRWIILVCYALLVALACAIETWNFDATKYRSWLILIGFALTVELVIVIFLEKWSRHLAGAFSILYRLALATPLVCIWLYNWRFGVPISQYTILALLQTTWFEIREFIVAYGRPQMLVVPAALALAILVIAVAEHRTRTQSLRLSHVVLLFALLVVQYSFTYELAWIPALSARTVSTYFAELKQFREIRSEREASLPSLLATKQGVGETYILVIGESQNRSHVGAYGYARETTPWLTHETTLSNVVTFNRAYSNHTLTVQVLSLALTAASQYNRRDYYGSPSIIDVARAAGFKTYWISNQAGLGGWDNAVTAIAETADVYISANKNVGETVATNSLDARLVEIFAGLRRDIDGTKNNLIIFHLMGNHQYYCNRFPPGFDKFHWTSEDKFHWTSEDKLPWNADELYTSGFINLKEGQRIDRLQEVDCYDNSILYTDSVLQKIYTRVQSLKGFRAMVYLSDHGEDALAGRAHEPGEFTFPMTHIPLLVWLSEEFVRTGEARVRALREHIDAIWTNDLLYDLLVGLAGIKTAFYDEKKDLSSEQFNLPSPLTLHGGKQISEDPALSKTKPLGPSSGIVADKAWHDLTMAARLKLGSAIDFKKGGNSRHYQMGGWSEAEPWGTWTDGAISKLRFALDAPPAKDLTISVRFAAFLPRKNARDTVQVLANGVVVDTWQIDQTDEVERTVRIPRDVAKRSEFLQLTFVIANPMSPAEAGLSDDARKLGIGVSQIEVR